jgi:UPF0755 protein
MVIIPSSQTDLIVRETRKTKWLVVVALVLGILILGIVCTILFVFSLNKAPKNTLMPISFTVEKGDPVQEIAAALEQQSLIKSKTLLYLIISTQFDAKNIKASTYVFEKPLSTYEIATRLMTGDFDSELVRFTHVEGERATAIAKNAKKILPQFDESRFLAVAIPAEGKLYPETYFVPKEFTAEELFSLLTTTYDQETAFLAKAFATSTLSERDVLILASILEREANSTTSMAMVSGILRNRLNIDMPLQADASIEYVLDKPLQELTPEDLKMDSPYNTYLNRGLPPTPIGNPGIDAITAALLPTPSDYFYYITDTTGVFHYAKTYAKHLDNIERYLR